MVSRCLPYQWHSYCDTCRIWTHKPCVISLHASPPHHDTTAKLLSVVKLWMKCDEEGNWPPYDQTSLAKCSPTLELSIQLDQNLSELCMLIIWNFFSRSTWGVSFGVRRTQGILLSRSEINRLTVSGLRSRTFKFILLDWPITWRIRAVWSNFIGMVDRNQYTEIDREIDEEREREIERGFRMISMIAVAGLTYNVEHSLHMSISTNSYGCRWYILSFLLG